MNVHAPKAKLWSLLCDKPIQHNLALGLGHYA